MTKLSSWLRSLKPREASSEYYEAKHAKSGGYQSNNWLLSEIPAILSIKPRSVLEIGCGNGRFLAAIRPHVESVIGVDWAKSPFIEALGVADLFVQADITKDALPQADIVCSADVLEHLAPDSLAPTLRRLHDAGRDQYHVIACYDDNHSHLSIMPPHEWEGAFRAISERYRLLDVRHRPGKRERPVGVISTFSV
jgi:SAM-dependent methyltransferase